MSRAARIAERVLAVFAGAAWAWAIWLCLVAMGWCDSRAQEPVVLAPAPAVADSLARAWDETNPGQAERGYCVISRELRISGVRLVTLDSLVRPDTVYGADPYAVAFRCPARAVPLHTHTPVTCRRHPMLGVLRATCAMGGADAYECFPSWQDVLHLTATRDSYAFIQCDRHALVRYGPLPSAPSRSSQ